MLSCYEGKTGEKNLLIEYNENEVKETPIKINEKYLQSKVKLVLLWSIASLLMVTAAVTVLQTSRDGGEQSAESSQTTLVCYYSTPAAGDAGALRPRDLHPDLCTHINVAFARVRNSTILLDSDQLRTIKDIVKLKNVNPKLKILLSVGGAGGDDGFKNMVKNHASRKTFIKSIKFILRNYTLDGVDLDWEFPEVHSDFMSKEKEIKKRERQHFSQLLREIRSEYIREKRNYLLSVAVAAPETIASVAYDVDQLELYVDYVNVMTYDYHYFTKYTPFTGLNSPLYARPEEQLYLATLNINYTVNMYVNKGLSKNKIVVGIPTYGHTFTLVNPNNPAIGSPVSGFGSLGSQGFTNYPDVCAFIQKYKSQVVINEDKSARVPYLYKDREWVSYDTPHSVVEKVQYIKETGLRGAMIYSLNADDYSGNCSENPEKDKFPLVQAARNSLMFVEKPRIQLWQQQH